MTFFPQRILFRINPKIKPDETKKAFVLACQNQDLSILKLLIKKEQLKLNHPQNHGEQQSLLKSNDNVDGNDTTINLDDTLLNADTLEQLLFDKENIFIHKIIGKKSDLANYLREVYRTETGKDFPTPDDETLANIQIKFDALDDMKFLYELQMLDGDLDLNMDLVSSLNLGNNVDLMMLNHRSHFNKIDNMKTALINLTKNENIKVVSTLIENYLDQEGFDDNFKRSLFQASVNGRSPSMTALFIDKFPELMRDEELFLKCEASDIFHTIQQFPLQFDEKVLLKYIFRFFQYAVKHDKDENIKIMIKKFPDIGKDERLFEHCDGAHILKALKNRPNEYQDTAIHKFIKTAFIHTVHNSNSADGKFLLDNFPNLTIDETLLEADNSVPTISIMLKIYPAEFGGKAIEQDLNQALDDSNSETISSYIDSFPVLRTFQIAESVCQYAITHSKIPTIYQILDKVDVLKQSKDEQIKCLLENNLRQKVISSNDHDILTKWSIPSISLALKHFPENFGGKSMDLSLVEAISASDLNCITSYINTFPFLFKKPVLGRLWKHVLQNGNIHAIYHMLENVEGIHKSEYLISYLLNTDLRKDEILPKEVNIDVASTMDCPPLHLAVEAGATDIVRILLSKGAKVDMKDAGTETAIHYAARGGFTNVIRLLIQFKANIEAPNVVMWKAIHLASFRGHHEVVEILLHYGADPNSINDDGDTPLHKAAEEGFPKVVKVLLKYKAEKDKADNNGRTPYQDAKAYIDDERRSSGKEDAYQEIMELLKPEVSS